MREQLRELREFRIAGAERRRALAGKAGEPVEDVHGIVGAALFAVIYNVDAAFDLLLHPGRARLVRARRRAGRKFSIADGLRRAIVLSVRALEYL
jgi:hypothetical protein